MDKLKALWEKIKKWAVETALPWLKKGWLQIVNVLIVLFAYGKFDDLLQGQEIHLGLVTTIVGLWGFILLGYWIFWKFLGADKAIKSLITQRKKKKK